MKKSILLSFALFFTALISNAQTVLQLNGLDCNSNSHDLYADLDAGKAVVLFFFMDNCGSCPPPARTIQTMANNIMAEYPGMMTGYAMPYNNSTSCTATSNWVSSNSLSFYMPYDSGTVQVAHYGGFGMPSAVLLGGTDHRVMFSTLSFANADTIVMRDSIINLFSVANNIKEIPSDLNSLTVYPNPASATATVNLDIKSMSNVQIDILDMLGRPVTAVCNEIQSGNLSREINTENLTSGIYNIRILINGKTINRRLNVLH